MLQSLYPECHYAKCHYPECHYAKCHYPECHYAKCHYAERRYAERRYAQCLGTVFQTFCLFNVATWRRFDKTGFSSQTVDRTKLGCSAVSIFFSLV